MTGLIRAAGMSGLNTKAFYRDATILNTNVYKLVDCNGTMTYTRDIFLLN